METGVALIDWFLAALDELGYLIVFGFTIFENLFLIGSPVPGETVVVAGAIVASRGGLSLTGVWLASFAGTLVGANLTYWGGRRAGIEAIESFVGRIAATKLGRVFGVTEETVGGVYDHFHTEGSKTVLISRFAIGAKNIVPAIAGATRMPVFWFELYTMLGAMLYTSLMCIVGWFLGENLDLALDVVQGIGLAGLALLVAFIVVVWQVRRRIKQRRAVRDFDTQAVGSQAAAAAHGAEAAGDADVAEKPDASDAPGSTGAPDAVDGPPR